MYVSASLPMRRRSRFSRTPGPLPGLVPGAPGEPTDQRAARLAVAREVLAELLEAGAADDIAMQDALFAVRLGGAELMRADGRAAPAARPKEAA